MTNSKKQKGHLVAVNDPSSDIAISVQHVSKSFILPHNKQNSIKGGLINIFNGDKSYEVQKVLKNISFDIHKGDFFGIVGRNGSGKSTLLKMLAGIYTPTLGKVIINGSLTPFIELGVGFNPELTGRENVFLNGALLGFNRHEMAEMYDEIVEFAELERFMDQRLKNYSSGMQVRLAFSIAIRAQSDILLLDEVLAVGDSAFQQKCFNYFKQLKDNKRTVIFVSHDMNAVKQFCSKGIFVKKGEVEVFGSVEMITDAYNDEMLELLDPNGPPSESSDTKSTYNKDITINSVSIHNDNGSSQDSYDQGEYINIDVSYTVHKDINDPVFGITLLNSNERHIPVFAVNTQQPKSLLSGKHNKGQVITLRARIENRFTKGKYVINVAASNTSGALIYDKRERELAFISIGTINNFAYFQSNYTAEVTKE
ncbi:MAG: transporter protein [Patescibacteria group bacterium]|nr:transporter protein [Patescibacteria group bacterium]